MEQMAGGLSMQVDAVVHHLLKGLSALKRVSGIRATALIVVNVKGAYGVLV